jgi:signal transduction histidine kinase
MFKARLFRNASFRLAALYAILFAISASLLFGIIYWIASKALLQQIHDALARESSALADDFQSGGMDELLRSIAERLTAPELPPTYALLLDASGRKLAGNLDRKDKISGFMRLPRPPRTGREADHDEDNEHGVIAFGRELPEGAYLLVGEDGDRIDEAKEAILRAFGWGMATVLVLSVGGGILISIGFLKRIDAINRTTRAIMAGNLEDRVPTQATNDELDQLAANLNAMLDRIQVLMDSLRQVSSDIAHDLRMPLARLRQRLEGGKLRSMSEPEYQHILDAAIEDTDNILAIFSALLGITQIESGTRRKAFIPVDLAEILTTLAETYGAVAEDRGQTIVTKIPPGATVRGDRALLTQMFANLLENAIRHCPEGTQIALYVGRECDSVVASVSDNGPGIPKEEWTNVFKRFYRLDRSRSTSGSGLGLALVKAVADLHGATLELSEAKPGLQVCLKFPVSREGYKAIDHAT